MNLNRQTWNQKGCLPGSLRKFRGGKGRSFAKDLRVWPKTDPRTGHTFRNFSQASQFAVVHEGLKSRIGTFRLLHIGEDAGFAPPEGHAPRDTVAVYFDIQAFGESIYYRGTYAVKASGSRIGASPKLSTRVKLRKDQFHACEA